jgi:hypothetical protein
LTVVASFALCNSFTGWTKLRITRFDAGTTVATVDEPVVLAVELGDAADGAPDPGVVAAVPGAVHLWRGFRRGRRGRDGDAHDGEDEDGKSDEEPAHTRPPGVVGAGYATATFGTNGPLRNVEGWPGFEC